MSIRKHPQSGVWHIDITAPSGERIRRSTRTRDKRKAQELHDKIKAELWRQEQLGDKPKHYFEEACVLLLRESKGQADYATKVRHVRYWRNQFAGRTICSLTTQMILDALPTHQSRRDRRAQPLSRATQNRYLSTIRRMLSLAVEAGWIASAPTLRARRETNSRIKWMTHEQAQLFLESLSLEWMRHICAFALSTGCRQGEILSLSWQSIDIEQKVAWIHSDLSKSGKARAVPLSDDALNVLHKRHGLHPEHVFTRVPQGPRIRHIDYRDLNQAFKKAGAKDFTFHDLRHTWASWHAQAGTPLFVLKELGGWQTLEMVKRYAHLSTEHLSQYANHVKITSKSVRENKKAANDGSLIA